MEKQTKIRVLIVDDHAVVRQGIRTFLETALDLEVIGAARRRCAWRKNLSRTWPWWTWLCRAWTG